MQLEKVTFRSGQAALAGWISSNDVTLFTTVLVMAIAICMYARLTNGVKKNVHLTQENATLAERLEATSGELRASNSLVDQTHEALTLTQEERDQLRHQLVQEFDDVARLNTRLDALRKEKSKLESQHQSLIAANVSLSKEKANLLAQHVAIVGDRDSLKSKNVNLRERLEIISGQLAERTTAFEYVDDERGRLEQQAGELEAIVAGLKQRLDRLNHDLAEARADAATAQAQSQNRAQELETRLAVRDKTFDEHLTKLNRATAMIQGLTAEKARLQQALGASELKRQAELLEEGRNNRELLGLTGRLDRIAVLFDASGSMGQATASGSDRWDEAQETAAKWLQHLNVEQCVLIVYSSVVRTFPEDGSLADLRGRSGKANRDLLLKCVKAVSPGGWTNTYDALRKAYQYDVDTILLFSDGAPSSSDSGVYDPAMAKRIYDLCRVHPRIPIHTVGLGNYFQRDTSTFLMSLAEISNGTFRGQ